jgi:DNA polymerase-3 subunit delta
MIEGSGIPVADAVEQVQPPIHFRRKPLIESALKSWTSARLARAMAVLAEASLETRRTPALAAAIAQRAMLQIATAARRKD